MGDDSKRLEKLIESIADGDAIDWQRLENEAGEDEALRRLLHDLRLLSGVAAVHRSPDGEDNDPPARAGDPADASTRDRQVDADRRVGVGEGTQWGHLLLMQKIGEGTFGEVFHARDMWLDHSVALKLLKPHLTDRSRLLHEARTLVQIRHENVVRVHGADVHEGRIGFWMEFIEGQTLAEVVAREGVRSASEAAVIGQDLCRALAAVHGKNIVHRDVKAKNVMREHGGRIVLMDFGAGMPLGRGPARGLTGTPLYLAPELFGGDSATPQSDIYSLGVLLFHLVTAGYPVTGGSFEDLVAAHGRGERYRLGDVRTDLPDAFVRVVETMLSVDVTRRYATAATVRAALEGVVAPAAVYPVREGSVLIQYPITSQDDWGARLQRPVFLVAAVLIALTITGFATSILYNSPLGLTEGFESESPLEWPIWGFRALFAAAIVMAGLAMAWALLRILCDGAMTVFRPLRSIRDQVRARAAPHVERIRSMQVAQLASIVLLVQVAAIAAFGWRFQTLLKGLDAFISHRPPADLSALAPQNRFEQILFDVTLYVQVMVFGLAWFRLFRRRSVTSNPDATVLVASGIVATVLTFLLCQVVPFRILYHNDAERVSYGSQRCYLVGQRGREARLFCPLQAPPWNRIVQIDDPALKREGISENIFTVFDRND